MRKALVVAVALLVVAVAISAAGDNPYRQTQPTPLEMAQSIVDTFSPQRLTMITVDHLSMLDLFFQQRQLASLWDGIQAAGGSITDWSEICGLSRWGITARAILSIFFDFTGDISCVSTAGS
jgi:hypothetical protein